MIKTIIKKLPTHTVVVLYDENFVKRQRALNSLIYHTNKALKKYSEEAQLKLL